MAGICEKDAKCQQRASAAWVLNENLLQQTFFESLQFGGLIRDRLNFGIHRGEGVGDFLLFICVGHRDRELLQLGRIEMNH